LNDLFVAKGWGFKTRKDYLLVDFNKEDLSKRFTDIAKLAAKDAKVKYSIDESEYWDFEAAHKQLPKDPTVSIRPVLFRPFDVRSCFYEKYMIERGDHKYELMSQMFRPNLALVTVRRNESNRLFDHVFCTRLPAVLHSVSAKEANFFFPFLRHDSENDPKKPGQRDLFNSSIAEPNCKLAIRPEGDISNFNYVYAVLYSPGYRARYAEQLRIDFPRLPKTKNMELFTQLAKLGGELISLHLLESEKLAKNNPRFICDTNSKPEVDKVTWSNNCVWIDKAKKTGFKEVKEETWNFHIGGYQVCEKWLKDRKGRKLTKDDIEHYQKIVVALSETIRLMAEIDKVIDEHGGWPGAFRAAK
jgi:predicted helicase